MKFNALINNFTAGEWSPKMYGRADTDQYFRACRTLQNAIPKIQGGAFKRPGTKILVTDATANSINVNTRLSNATDVRVFEFKLSDGTNNTLFITNAAPNDASAPWTVSVGLDEDSVTNNRNVTDPVGVANTYAANLDTLEIRQVGDLVVITDGIVPPRYIKKRADGTAFDIFAWFSAGTGAAAAFNGNNAIPFTTLVANSSGPTITVTGTLTAGGSVTLGSPELIFNTTMLAANNYGIGTRFRFTSGGSTGTAVVTAFTSAALVTATVVDTIPGTSPVIFGAASGTAWDRHAWGGGSGWPRSFTLHQGAIYFGGSTGFTDTFWRSRIGNIFDFVEVPFAQDPDFATFAEDNSRPWTFTPNTDQVGNIVAMSSSKSLVILTDLSEIVLNGTNGALGPNDFNAESTTFYGSEDVQPARVGQYLTFVQRGGRLRDLQFSFDEYQYKSADLAFTSDHLGTIKRMVSSEYGSSILFAVTEEGELLTCTLERDYQITAWAKQIFGTDAADAPVVVDVAIKDKDTVRVLLLRDINGTDKYTYEELSAFYEGADDVNAALNDRAFGPYLYMDGARSIDKPRNAIAASDTFDFGATFFANAEVSVFGMPYFNTDPEYRGHIYLGEYTLNASGQLVAPEFEDYAVVTIGHRYMTRIIPMSIEQGAQFGSPVGKQRRVNDMFLRFYKTLGCKYGNARDGLYDIPMRLDSVGPDTASPLVTGTYYLKFPAVTSRDYEIIIESDQPHPLNVLAVGMEGMTYD